MNKPVEILTPAGRMVAGDCFKANTTDAENRQLMVKHGPNAGQPRVEYYVGIAIPKNDPGWPALWATICEVARRDFPTLFDATGKCINPKFAFKVIDGDSQTGNTKGTKPCDREGYPGHWILNFSSGFAPKCSTNGGATAITNPEELKRGSYIQIAGTVRGNGAVQQPGVFLNLQLIDRVGFGAEITSGKSGTEAFGGVAAALPAGASSTPLAPTTPISTGAPPLPGAPAAVAPPLPGAPAAVAPPLPGAPAAVAPAPDFLTPPAAVAPVKRKDPAGNAFTEAQLTAAGWTPEQIQALPIHHDDIPY